MRIRSVTNIEIVLALALAVCACTAPTPSKPIEPAPSAPALTREGEEAHVDNIGDVEAGIRIETKLAPDSELDTIEVEELMDRSRRINLVTLTVHPPYPEELWLTITPISDRTWPKNPVVLRGAVRADGQVIHAFTRVFDKDAFEQKTSETVDVLAHFETAPESVLVIGEAEAMLMPRDSDPATIDPATATAEPKLTTKLTGNPVRINFVSEPAPPAETPADM